MSDNTTLKTRIINKHDIEANWITASNVSNPFIPRKGEFIIYDPEIDVQGNVLKLPEGRTIPFTYARVKLGDGINKPSDLPFITDNIEITESQIVDLKNYKVSQEAIAAVETGANEFIDTIAQDENGNITITTKSVDFSGSTEALKNTFKQLQEVIAANTSVKNRFVDTIAQDEQGVITVTFKDVDFSDYRSAADQDAIDATFKTKQNTYTAEGSNTKTITKVTQNANGEVEVTYSDIDFFELDKVEDTEAEVPTADTVIVTKEITVDGHVITEETVQVATAKGVENALDSAKDYIDNKIESLDVTDISGFDAGKTLATLTETDGKIAATFQDIAITESQITDFGDYKSKQTAVNKTGNVKKTITGITQTEDGVIDVTFEDIDFSHNHDVAYKAIQTAVEAVETETNEFIDTIAQDAQGVVSITTKKVDLSAYRTAADQDVIDGTFKTKQTAVNKTSDTLKTVTSVNQNENGEINITFESIKIGEVADGEVGLTTGDVVYDAIESAKSELKGTKAEGDTTAETIAGAKIYADARKTEVVEMIEAVASAGLTRSIVTELPDASTAALNTIYMVKRSTGLDEKDVYDEYIVVEVEGVKHFELLGNTELDLTGYATEQYVDDKLDVLELTDDSVKLNSELKTYYNVGKITNASGTNPVTIGNKGDSLRNVFDRLFNMDEVQPKITENPSVSCTLSSSASDERGTEINSISYSITFNDGKYTNANTTGVVMTDYSFSNGTASSTTSTSGTITLPSTYTVGTSSAFSTTITANHDEGDVAKTNLGNNSNPEIKIASGSVSKALSFSKSAVDYPYYVSTTEISENPYFNNATKSTTADCGTNGVSITLDSNSHIWFLVSPTASDAKTIQYEALGQWYDFGGGTTGPVDVTVKLANGCDNVAYKAYYTNAKASAGTTKFRIK